jgi:hypothetical protein
MRFVGLLELVANKEISFEDLVAVCERDLKIKVS